MSCQAEAILLLLASQDERHTDRRPSGHVPRTIGLALSCRHPAAGSRYASGRRHRARGKVSLDAECAVHASGHAAIARPSNCTDGRVSLRVPREVGPQTRPSPARPPRDRPTTTRSRACIRLPTAHGIICFIEYSVKQILLRHARTRTFTPFAGASPSSLSTSGTDVICRVLTRRMLRRCSEVVSIGREPLFPVTGTAHSTTMSASSSSGVPCP